VERVIDYDASWRTDWQRCLDGEWWRMDSAHGPLAHNRIRVAAHHWATRRGMRVRSRTDADGRFSIRFDVA
jgi:hypothetical protein